MNESARKTFSSEKRENVPEKAQSQKYKTIPGKNAIAQKENEPRPRRRVVIVEFRRQSRISHAKFDARPSAISQDPSESRERGTRRVPG